MSIIDPNVLVSDPHTHPLTAWVHLSHIPKLGLNRLLKLHAHFNDPRDIVSADLDPLAQLIPSTVAQALIHTDTRPIREKIATWLAQNPQHQLITLSDADYPVALKNSSHPPPLLFLNGQRTLLNAEIIAIVGSRKATQHGQQNAYEFSRALSTQGFTIVSGLALGIDESAHRGALGSSASTIAVIGTGIDRVYPAKQHKLSHLIAEQGLIISDFPLGTPPKPDHFPRRNRIIAGLCRACLVVEADLQSGSLITARLANEYGRDVMAIPGSIHNPQARGCHQLIKTGARLTESIDDILDELGYALPSPKNTPTTTSPATISTPNTTTRSNTPLDADEQQLLNLLTAGPTDSDTLVAQTGLTINEVCTKLLTLEMEGYIETLSGGRYQRRDPT